MEDLFLSSESTERPELEELRYGCQRRGSGMADFSWSCGRWEENRMLLDRRIHNFEKCTISFPKRDGPARGNVAAGWTVTGTGVRLAGWLGGK